MISAVTTDEIVRALVDRNGPVILKVDHETNACIVAVVIDAASNDPDNGRLVPRLEYQVSDGLPGHRGSSNDCDTYEEAVALLPKVIEDTKRFGIVGKSRGRR